MEKKKPVTMSLGEVLWDMLPDGKALGGSPTNVAWHAAQLGADAHVVSSVGRDDLGTEILDRLKEMRLDISAIAIIPDKPTSTVDAILDAHGNATYVIRDNVAWDCLPLSDISLAIAKRASAINFGSLSQRSETSRNATRALLDAAPPDSIRIFDINLRPPFILPDVLDGGMKRSTVVKMNDDELPVISKAFDWPERHEDALERMFSQYPNLKHAIITRGAKGAWWYNGKQLFEEQPQTKVAVVDTIGAGDSVTAAAMMGLLNGWNEETILKTALKVASFVCSNRGGTPELSAEVKAPFMKN